MQKPRFSVVSMVCVLLGLLGLGLMVLRPHLPLQQANAMKLEGDEYLRQGANQQIKWRTLTEATLAEARRFEKPIMLVMGIVGSRDARLADNTVFADQDVQSFLERNFISVRVDLDSQPYLANAFLPISRGEIGIRPSFQIWFLTPEGNLFDFLGRRGIIDSDPQESKSSRFMLELVKVLTDPNSFLDELADVRESYEKYANSPGSSLQEADRALFENDRTFKPDLASLVVALQQSIPARWGGFPVGGTQMLRMSAIQMLLEASDLQSAHAAVDPMLRSGIVDWLDGGFFRQARRADWKDIEYDKLALPNSEAMRVLATYAVLTQDQFAERIAKNTFDTLVSHFVEQGFIATARIGDEDKLGRSSKSSFAAKNFRQIWGTGLLTAEEAISARKLFGLEVETNPQMSLRVTDPSAFDSPHFETILTKLRENKNMVKSRYSKTASAYVNGAVCAAMYFVSRLWGDAAGERLKHAEDRFESLSAFGTGADIMHHTLQRPEDRPFLGDYLAMAEVCLERFLATGDARSLERGAQVLVRTRALFDGPNGWTPTTDRINDLIAGSNYPQVVDGNNESLYARSIRLANAYGRLLRGGSRSALAGALSQDAIDMVGRGYFLVGLGASAAGYGAASAQVLDDAHAVVVGPRATERAAELFRLRPTRLVAPAIGVVRQDLQKRAPGIYLVVGSDVTGPFGLDEAANKLPPAYTL